MSRGKARRAEKQPAPRPSAARRVTLALLLAPTLIALALLAWATLSHSPRPVQTGDALLDEFLEILAYEMVNPAETGSLLEAQEYPARREWKALEQQFSANSRVWVLMYHMRSSRFKIHASGYGFELSQRSGGLEDACARGVMDWMLFYNLLEYDTRAGGQSASYKQYCSKLRQYGNEQAQAHYLLAHLAAERGKIAVAISELKAGNAAPHNAAYYGLPYDELTASASSGQLLGADSISTGLLALAYDYIAIPVNGLEYMARSIADWAVAHNDMATLEVLHQACCRYAMCSGLGELHVLMAARADSVALAAIRKLAARSTDIDLAALDTANELLRLASNAAMGANPHNSQTYTPPNWLGVALQYSPAYSSANRYHAFDQLRVTATDLIHEQTTLAGPVRQQFEALSALDFTP